MKNLYFHLIFSILMLCVLPGSAQVPVYNSLPSAAATIYLDFDGHLVSGTSWNMNGPFQCASSNLSDDKIKEVFNRVAEDYRPFNVNITTDSAKYQQAPAFQRMRVVLTISSQWYGSAGGVSYVGSFNWGDNTPSFVFTALLNYNAKNIAEATAHEIGHTLGLRHQAAYDGNCMKTAEYNAGVGSGEIGWAPIMGVGYYRNFTLWNNGANPYGCTNYQDDLGIITSTVNGFGFRPDDHSNQIDQTATAAQFSNNHFNLSGVIEKISDRDVFRFILPVLGNFHVDALPYNIGSGNLGSNLDMQVELINSSNEVIGIYNPDLQLGSQIDTMLNAGTYYIRIEGKGNQYAPEYASLGSYNLNAVYQPSVVLPVHRIELNGSGENNRHSFNWIIEADEAVTEQVLEVADNGTDFRQMAALSPATRSYHYYVSNNNRILYYRLNVHFENGQRYLSNIVALRHSESNGRPALAGNMVLETISINTPVPFSYSILDYNGRLVAKGSLSQGMNRIDAARLGTGMYLIQYNNGQEQFSEKFMKH